MPNIGLPELLILLVILLLLFGAKRLPSLGRAVGQGMKEFKDSVSGKNKDSDSEDEPVEITATADQAQNNEDVVDGEVVSEQKTNS